MTDKEKELQAEAIGYYRKRIAELEMTVGTLRNFSNEQATCIERLKKENAELKDDNKVMADNYSKMEQKFYDNLTKAKELMKEFVQHYKAKTIYIENMQDLLEQAGQFLSEVEK